MGKRVNAPKAESLSSGKTRRSALKNGAVSGRAPRFNDSIAQDPDMDKWAWLDGNVGHMQAIKD